MSIHPNPKRSGARTPPPTLLFPLNNVKEQNPERAWRRVRSNRAADDADLVPGRRPVNRLPESFCKLSSRSAEIFHGPTEVKAKQQPPQKRCRFCAAAPECCNTSQPLLDKIGVRGAARPARSLEPPTLVTRTGPRPLRPTRQPAAPAPTKGPDPQQPPSWWKSPPPRPRSREHAPPGRRSYKPSTPFGKRDVTGGG
ncbi:hypothetical protein MicloDRAFT_00022780 [Microvirga lotononidis]|uniref:Uncharacterized protein n=1 Tax=Microvirga lotononidis TaxID=864069 RepID=I4Z0Q3_9HYPH|nr:hypothetical protein MicloDRAFT_00022780 [Microvirga lotononidis]